MTTEDIDDIIFLVVFKIMGYISLSW